MTQPVLYWPCMLSRGAAVPKRVRDLANWLRAARPAKADLLGMVTRELAPVLGTEQTVAYGLDTEDERVRLTFLASPFGRIQEIRREVTALIERHPTNFAHFDPRSPPPTQRNTVVTLQELRRSTGVTTSPMLRLLAAHGFATEHQLRMLLCDGPAMLAWVGAFRERPFGQEDRAILKSILGPLRERLTLECRLEDVPWALAALDPALDSLGSAAVVVRRPLRLLHCNAPARTLLEKDRAAFLATLREGLDGHGDGTWIVTPLGLLEGSKHFLAIRRRPPRDVSGPAAAAGLRYGLTKGQVAVLEMLARGDANKTIAVALKCSESAVEQHVTNLLRRYSLESRAQLVARFWTDAT